MYARGENVQVALTKGGHDGSAQSLHVVSRGPEVWVRSQPLSAPQTGRITVWARLRIREGGPQPELRLAIEARHRGRPYYRFANVGAGSPTAELSSQWAPFILQIDDLPRERLDEFRIGFDLMSQGEVWIDDVVIYDTSFTSREQLQISKQIAAADYHLREENVAAAAQLLDGYWPQFLLEHIEAGVPEIREPPRRPPSPEDDEDPDPPIRQSFLNRARGWWPF